MTRFIIKPTTEQETDNKGAKEKNMKHYEYTYLTRQDMPEDAAKKLQDQIADLVTSQNGTVGEISKAYKKRLAYRIKKQEAAYVNTILFQAKPAVAVNLKKETDAYAEILRGLVVSYDPEKLKREPRRERPSLESKTNEIENAIAKEEPAATQKTAKTETPKEIEKKEEEKESLKETREEKKETKKTAKTETPKEIEKKEEENKPKTRRRAKVKAELRDIEEKLDEILK